VGLAERVRLRSTAGRVLRALARLHLRAGELDAASEQLQRLAELEPLDADAQRQLLTLLLRRGRRSEAARRYEVVRRRFHRAFGRNRASSSPSWRARRRPSGPLRRRRSRAWRQAAARRAVTRAA
jgi:DNA-binding SARP family transcriptional activator